MICVSVMLAILQLWPMVFGQSVTPAEVAATAAPGAHAAARVPSPMVALASSGPVEAMKSSSQAAVSTGHISCYRHYEIAFAACAPSDRACRMKSADQWDLCEATGFWGN
ncbi:hypothetical protein [Sphingomonas sp. 28-63-12]|uniref:hypothetical protein n=1 Tax=Sphingomonas sp. 28-63-12 TaxID=1970434 RepID=UPI0035A97B61